MIKKLLGIDKWENNLWNRGYDKGKESAEIDCCSKISRNQKKAYEDGYKDGKLEGMKYIGEKFANERIILIDRFKTLIPEHRTNNGSDYGYEKGFNYCRNQVLENIKKL